MTQGDPVARLAVDLGKVTERVGQVDERIALVEQTVTDTVSELAEKVAELAAAVAVQPSDPQESGERVDGRPWAALQKEGYGDTSPFSDLCAWIETILMPQYQEYLALPNSETGALPRCWPKHPAACNELWTLYLLWDHAFANEETGPREAGDWHDRWLPGTLDRLDQVFRGCLHTAGS